MKHWKTRPILRLITLALLMGGLLASCTLAEPGVNPPDKAIYFPIGMALHPDKRHVAVVNANFNLSYRFGTISIIDLGALDPAKVETGSDRIISQWTVPIGTFGGQAVFNAEGNRLYVTVRGARQKTEDLEGIAGDMLYEYRVHPDAVAGQSLFLDHLRTVPLSPDPFGMALDRDGRFLYVSHVSNGELGIVQAELGYPADEALATRFYAGVTEPSEGDDLLLHHYCTPEAWTCHGVTPSASGSCGPCDQCGQEGMCIISARDDTSRFCLASCETDADCGEGYVCQRFNPTTRVAERKLDSGGNAVAIHPLTGSVYVSSKYSLRIGVVMPYYREGATVETLVDFFDAAFDTDIRDMDFYLPPASQSPVQALMFAAARNADDYPGLAVIDVSEDPAAFDARIGRGLEVNRQIDFIPTCQGPASLAQAGGLLFVSCFDGDAIEVYDIVSGTLVDHIVVMVDNRKVHMGPYDMVAYTQDGSDDIRLLVAMFSGHEIQLWQVSRPQGQDQPHQLLLRVHNHAIRYN